jgi:RNase P/RNase MRP subunit p29
MDILKINNIPKLLGIGEALVLEVKQEDTNQHWIRVRHPDLGDTTFIPYIQTAGIYRVPRIGDICFVFSKENFIQYPVAWGHQITQALAKELIGNRTDDIMVIYTPGPQNNGIHHKITLDDKAGIAVETNGGNKVLLENRENITVQHTSGSFIRVNEAEILLSIKGTSIKLSQEGIELISAQGAKQELKSEVKIVSSQGSEIQLDGSITGKAQDKNSKFDEVTVPNHLHIGNLGYPTTAPQKGT